jgi:GNAT superfamily N-acetyltransferase
MSGFVFRPGEPGDAEGIARVFVETWRATYPGLLPDRVLVRLSQEAQSAYWARLLQRRRGAEFVWVAAGARNRVAGFGGAGPERHGAKGQGEIYTLYVRPDFHGLGLGRGLLEALLAGLAERGAASALLWVVEGNPSRFFYERLGGKLAHRRVERLWGQDVPQLGYVWTELRERFGP